MKSLKKIAPILLIVIIAFSWYNVLNGSISSSNDYNRYIENAKKNLEDGLPSNAVENIQAAMEIKESPEPVYMMAEYYIKNEEHDNCIDWCESYLEAFKKDSKLYGYLCKEYIALGNYSDCIELLKSLAGSDVYNKELKGYYDSIKYEYTEIGNRYDDISPSLNGYCVVKRGEYYGTCSVNGEINVQEKYLSIGGFFKTDNGLRCTAIDKNGIVWLLDTSGTPRANISSSLKEVSDIKKVGLVSDGVFSVCDSNGVYSLIRISDYSVVTTGYSYIGSSINELIPVKKDEKWFFINTQGQRVSELSYDEIKVNDYGTAFSGDIAFVKNNGKYSMIDNKEKSVSETFFNEVGMFYFGNSPISICKDKKWGFADQKGKIMFNNYVGTVSYRYNYGAFSTAGKWGFIDINGKTVVKDVFDGTKGFVSPSTAAVKYGNEWCLIKFNISSELE